MVRGVDIAHGTLDLGHLSIVSINRRLLDEYLTLVNVGHLDLSPAWCLLFLASRYQYQPEGLRDVLSK